LTVDSGQLIVIQQPAVALTQYLISNLKMVATDTLVNWISAQKPGFSYYFKG